MREGGKNEKRNLKSKEREREDQNGQWRGLFPCFFDDCKRSSATLRKSSLLTFVSLLTNLSAYNVDLSELIAVYVKKMKVKEKSASERNKEK